MRWAATLGVVALALLALGIAGHHVVREKIQARLADDLSTLLQAEVTAVRKTIQARPMIPMLKAIVAHFTGDPGWAKVRPPFLPLDAAEAQAGIAELTEQYGFELKAA